MNNKKQTIRELIQNHGNIAHDTGIPLYVLDDMEIGRRSLQLSNLHILAKYYGKKIHIQLVD